MSSHMTPKPPLILASKYLMGGGLAISNNRNRPNAVSCARKVPGTSHSTSQNATISSHTIPTWSSTCNSRATRWHAQQPYANARARKMASAGSDAAGAAAAQISQASSVPQVPEAGRNRPLPRPKAISRPGSPATQRGAGYATRTRLRIDAGDESGLAGTENQETGK